MATIKYDVSGSDPQNAKGGALAVPKKGVKIVKIESIKDRRPDKNDMEVKAVIAKGDNKNYPYWDYVNFGEASEWRMDQFLMAIGVATETSKRKGEFDPVKIVKAGKLIKVDTRVETDEDGDPVRSRIRSWIGIADDEDDEGDDETQDDEGDEDTQDDEGDSDEGDEGEAEAEGDDYDEWEVSDLRAELKDRGLETKGAKSALVTRLRESDGSPEDGADAEPEADEYDEWEDADIKSELKDRGLNASGRRATLIARLREDDGKGSAFDE